MEFFIEPFQTSFVFRALLGAILVATLAAIVGTWVVVRGLAFLGEAIAHGMLPGVAIASLVGGNLLIGAAASALSMALGVTVLRKNTQFKNDTSIGLLFVGMLSLGVIIVSYSNSFAVDLTSFLFGDVLAVTEDDLYFLLIALAITILLNLLCYRAFVSLSFDPRKAQTLGLSPQISNFLMLGLVVLSIVASFQVVGTLLVFGLLVAPPATALMLASRIRTVMLIAAILGSISAYFGLLLSWYAGTAAGASITAVSVAIFFVVAIFKAIQNAIQTKPKKPLEAV